MSTHENDSIISSFNAVRWHDSKLLSLAFHRIEKQDEVSVSIQMQNGVGQLTPSTLLFEGSTYIRLEVDLEGKRVCADSIFSATCQAESDFLTNLKKANPYDSFQGYLHFRIELVPPGGWIDLLATGFQLKAAV
jgi:hypothetical protein